MANKNTFKNNISFICYIIKLFCLKIKAHMIFESSRRQYDVTYNAEYSRQDERLVSSAGGVVMDRHIVIHHPRRVDRYESDQPNHQLPQCIKYNQY